MSMKLLQTIISFCGGVLCWLFGPWDTAMAVLVCCVALDYITGVVAAAVNKELNSRVGFIGILKKVCIFLMVGLAALVDRTIPAANDAVRAAVCIFYIANEALSMLENAGSIGLPLPEVLRNTIEKLKKE